MVDQQALCYSHIINFQPKMRNLTPAFFSLTSHHLDGFRIAFSYHLSPTPSRRRDVTLKRATAAVESFFSKYQISYLELEGYNV